MSQARTERRAAERRATKLARKANQTTNPAAAAPTPEPTSTPVETFACFNHDTDFNEAAEQATTTETFTPEPEPAPKPTISEAKLAANRTNSQKSTGPRSDESKSYTRLNALTHGLTGQTILLPTDDAIRYQNHCEAYRQALKPVGHFELTLVQHIADHDWRLDRIPVLEANLYALGQYELADESVPSHLLEAHIQITYEKHFRNLHLQQNRLTRYRANDLAELKALQQARLEEEQQNYEQAAALQQKAEAANQTFHPENVGFVFSTADLAAFREAKSDLRLTKRLIQLRSENQKIYAQAA